MKIISCRFLQDGGDWFILQKADAVNAIAETPYIVLFGTNNGIYTQDKFTEAIEYSYDLSKELSSNKIYHIIYNQYTPPPHVREFLLQHTQFTIDTEFLELDEEYREVDVKGLLE